MSFKSITIFIYFVLSTLITVGQDKKAISLYEKGEAAAHKKDFILAQEFYLKAGERSPGFAEPHFKIGQYFALTRNLAKAKEFYEKAIQLSPDNISFITAYSFLGTYYFDTSNFTKAKSYYQFAFNNAQEGSKYAQQLSRQIERCDFVNHSMTNAYDLEPEKLTEIINGWQQQYFPVLTPDESQLIFTVKDENENEDIYISSNVAGQWTQPVSISDSINSPLNEGTCSVSANGKMIVFTSCTGSAFNKNCDLLFSQKEAGEWRQPQSLGDNINSLFWESQPSLSNDGKVLYFASNRPGGKGGEDIYQSTYTRDNGWAPAINLGDNVNTPGDECSPFIHANGKTLFFASNYRIGMGGFDLFLSQKDTSGFSDPLNLGYPINTKDDQVAMFISANSKRAYYSVQKGDSLNLYKFQIPVDLEEKIESTIYVKGRVVDEFSKKGVYSNVELYDLSQNEIISSFESDKDDGSFFVVVPSKGKYALYVSKKDHFFKRFDFDVDTDGTEKNSNLEVTLKKIEKTKVEVLEHIYFASASYELLPTSKSELVKLVELALENPSLGIEISGHTDDIGSENDNQELSEKRALAVVTYLEKAGIKKERLNYQGYGEARPKVPNDSKVNQQINRRIELSFF